MADSRRKSKKRRFAARWRGFIYIGLIAFSVFCSVLMANDIGTWLHINQEVHANEKLLDELTSQQSELETTRKNLTNPDYLEMIARGKYHVSKNGEQVFVFPQLGEEEEDQSDSSSSQSSNKTVKPKVTEGLADAGSNLEGN